MRKYRDELIEFVTKMHGDQKRKYTGEPYVNHLLEVESILVEHSDELIAFHGEGGYALALDVALCHDLFEDTACDKITLLRFFDARVSFQHAIKVAIGVDELTDVFTHKAYPEIRRDVRKIMEAGRMAGTGVAGASGVSQSVKYADILSNGPSIIGNDPKFAKTYVKECKFLLGVLGKGEPLLKEKCLETLERI